MSEGRRDPDLRAEAHSLLHNQGLLALLETFGDPRPHGSYTLDLMVWRDLDIYLIIENESLADFFLLGGQVASLLRPVRMSFRNELVARSPALPAGLYWGVHLAGDPGWKIDIWAVSQAEYERHTAYESDLQKRLTDDSRRAIRYLKARFWQHPLYRQSFFARDIYDAVVYDEVIDPDAFVNYLVDKGIHI
jgi:hypothetical protein